MKKKVVCKNCREETFLRSEPVYEGFKKVGEAYFCMLCGFAYEQEALPDEFVEEKSSFFSENDLEKIPDLFADERDADNCRKCKHYIVNAFQQKCGLTQKDVLATDVCFYFEKKEDDDEE